MKSKVGFWTLLAILAIPCPGLQAGEFSAESAALEALNQLVSAPATYDAEGDPTALRAGELKTIYFDALEFRGAPTRVFAWLGIPEDTSVEKPLPGIVLVHGGGGSAFRNWVEMWNERGYAAISIAVEGQTDDYSPGTRPRNWFPHAWPGPAREGIYGDSDESFRDQWMYHAVADTILANSLLRSLPEVDADKVGIMGISWGGIITSTVIGIDTRFAFAIPTYGGGYLHEMDNQYGRALESIELFKKVWDPAIRIHRATMPTLWYSWPGDKHFSLDAQAATYRTAPGVRMVSLVPGMGHSHAAAWDRPESYDFADSVVKTGRPWCVQTGLSVDGSDLEVEFSCSRILNSATLLANTGDGHTGERDWSETDARLNRDAGGAWIVSATLPPGTDGWFVNVHADGADGDDDGDGWADSYGYKAAIVIASSDYHEIEDTRHPLVGNSQTRRDP